MAGISFQCQVYKAKQIFGIGSTIDSYKKHHCNNLSEFDYALRAERNRVILRANECMGTSATSSHARVRAQND